MKQLIEKWANSSQAWRNITLGILVAMFALAGILGWAGNKSAQDAVFIVGFILALLSALMFYKYMRKEHDSYDRNRNRNRR